jgi:phospholipase C
VAITRRRFLAVAGAALASGALRTTGASLARRGVPAGGGAGGGALTPRQQAALAALGRSTLREPGSRYDPTRPVGTDLLPGIDNIVIFMLENHSYDNFLGMLGRAPGEAPRGEGFSLDASGAPTATNPYADGRVQHAFHMPTTCQLGNQPTQEWKAAHEQYDGGTLQGFVRSGSGPVAMGYWTGDDLPFTYSLATAFPIGDRWFCSLLGQTEPNRRYLIAATSAGLTDDLANPLLLLDPPRYLKSPKNGTIFEQLSEQGIPWRNYVARYPGGATPDLYYAEDAAIEAQDERPFDDFFGDAAEGRLPAVSLLDPDYLTQSQENPQNIVVGEALLARVVHALGSSPQWLRSLLVVVYDEHGGYYDHVPPPVALPPDDIPPCTHGEPAYDGFARYGFRVPAIVVSPYARRHHVSSVLHDHTSILAMVERKWNLPALTYRDANANDLTDFLDRAALAAARPTFPALPPLAAPGDTAAARAGSARGPGVIPPPGSVTAGASS